MLLLFQSYLDVPFETYPIKGKAKPGTVYKIFFLFLLFAVAQDLTSIYGHNVVFNEINICKASEGESGTRDLSRG